MTSPLKALFVVLTVVLTVGAASCAGTPPSAPQLVAFNHPTLGRVTEADPRYKAAREACERKVYSQGVTIDGKTVTDPEQALRTAARGLGDQARAAAADGSGQTRIEKPAHFQRMLELDRRADTCMIEGGWKPDVPERKPFSGLSASNRSSLLELHRQGRLKLTPEEVAELQKGLWW